MDPNDAERGASGPEERTLLARDRTVLAFERTYAAWLRTGLAFLLAGLAAEGYLRGPLPHWPLRLIAFILTACAVASFAAAAWCDHRLRVGLPGAQVRPLPAAVATGLALILVVVSALSGLALALG